MFPVDETPFVMELLPYRLPTWKTTLRHMWDKCAQYLRKMGGMILVASVVVWFLSYPPRRAGNAPGHYENSPYLGRLGRTCERARCSGPLGLNFGKRAWPLLSGVPARDHHRYARRTLLERAPAAGQTAAHETIEIVAESGEMTNTAKLSINDFAKQL